MFQIAHPRVIAALIAAVPFIAFGMSTAYASTPDASAPAEIFVTISYVLGTLTAIVYKMSVGSAKHIVGKTFRLRALLWPILWSAIISFPLVFMIMPKFGRPTGFFWTDAIYAYLTTYAVIDMASDFFVLSDIIRAKFQEAVAKDARESHPDDAPSSQPPSSTP
ncbi:MAG TPA: hypothetical protein VN397_05095 [Candidatus Methylomirabilis sp.]|nr:hypothetical protein [Candidatus Methylomirabilis sp.]